MASQYSYSSSPQPISNYSHTQTHTHTLTERHHAARYKNDYEESKELEKTQQRPLYNLMNDKRVKRGTNFPAKNKQINQQNNITTQHINNRQQNDTSQPAGPQRFHSPSQRRRHAHGDSKVEQRIEFIRISTPEPVTGRVHTEVQTEKYIEDLRRIAQKQYNKIDQSTQFEQQLDVDTNILFIPQSSGVDVGTEIDHQSTEHGGLFDFSLEVEPVLHVLIEKTIEESLLEVNEEIERAAIAAAHAKYESIRIAAAREVQRLQRIDDARSQERLEREEQAKRRLMALQEHMAKQSADRVAYDVVTQLTDDVIIHLSSIGYFYDPVERSVEQIFLPYILQQVEQQLGEYDIAQQAVDKLIGDAIRRSKR